jgi:hypothetical protein
MQRAQSSGQASHRILASFNQLAHDVHGSSRHDEWKPNSSAGNGENRAVTSSVTLREFPQQCSRHERHVTG